jgi:predicted double-glycine peptidase
MGLPASALPGFVLVLASLSLAACATTSPVTATPPPLSDAWAQVPGITLVRQKSRSDCGSAALAMVLSHFDRKTDVTQVRNWLGSGEEKASGKIAGQESDAEPVEPGIAAGRLRDLARERGLRAYVIEATFTDLANELGKGHPVLVGLYRVVGNRGYPHYEVVVGLNRQEQEILTADPAEGWRKESVKQFAARWHLAKNLAVVIFPDAVASTPDPT